MISDYVKCEVDYKKYVDEHRANVVTAWHNMMKNDFTCGYLASLVELDDGYISFIHRMNKRIEAHDLSKYEKEEWEPYRRYFYPVDEEEKEKAKDDFNKAWEHHYTVNPHHWDHWVAIDKIGDMTLEDVTEMACDWIAMSMKFGGSALDWYHKQTDIELGYFQKIWIENILEKYYKI